VIDFLKLNINRNSKFLREKLKSKGVTVPDDFTIPATVSVHHLVREVIGRFFSDREKRNVNAFKQLIDLAESFGNSLEDFIKFFDLGTDTDTCDTKAEKVSLMTLHASKGLEFKCVFIPGCDNNIIPYTLFRNRSSYPGPDSEHDFPEEKRLLYVGMTRAKRFLYLSSAEKRYIFGREYHFEKSPFLTNIEHELAEHSKKGNRKGRRKKDIQMDLF
jgi:superfamily I DNA/RNA helicase